MFHGGDVSFCGPGRVAEAPADERRARAAQPQARASRQAGTAVDDSGTSTERPFGASAGLGSTNQATLPAVVPTADAFDSNTRANSKNRSTTAASTAWAQGMPNNARAQQSKACTVEPTLDFVGNARDTVHQLAPRNLVRCHDVDFVDWDVAQLAKHVEKLEGNRESMQGEFRAIIANRAQVTKTDGMERLGTSIRDVLARIRANDTEILQANAAVVKIANKAAAAKLKELFISPAGSIHRAGTAPSMNMESKNATAGRSSQELVAGRLSPAIAL